MSRRANVCCPHHPDAILVEDHHAGDTICPECGTVVGDRVVDVGSEWRTFSDANSDPSRVGASENPLLDGSDLSTTIARSGMDDSGMARYSNRQAMSSSTRTLVGAFRDICNMADRLSLPRGITDQANALFKKVYDSRSLRGRSNSAIAAACLYIACRQEQVPRSFAEVKSVSEVTKKEIGRCFKLIVRAMETSVDIISSTDFMSRFCSNLSLPAAVQRAAQCIARLAIDKDVTPGRSPISVAAAAIYMASQASDVKKSQRQIADVAGTAEQTIKQSYRLMLARAAELFPPDFVFHTPINQLPPA